MLKNIASGEGDLTRRLEYARQDELGELAGWFNRFLDKLQPIIADVKNSVIDARGTADQSAAIASQTSAGMQQQYREVDQVATAFQEMSATAQDVAHNAAQAAEAARNADQASQEGLQVIGQTTNSIELLANEMNVAMQEVEGLASSSEQIGSVLETNLLALNAAIEAARAGEAGRGFAVVADEVRNLAKRTQDSVEEIRQVIEGLQSGTREVVSTMHSSHRQAQGSVDQVSQAVAALQRISQAVSLITDMNLQIASAAEEQSSVAEEINRNVASIRDVTESISAQADESAQVSQNLNRLANHQQSLMDQFRAGNRLACVLFRGKQHAQYRLGRRLQPQQQPVWKGRPRNASAPDRAGPHQPRVQQRHRPGAGTTAALAGGRHRPLEPVSAAARGSRCAGDHCPRVERHGLPGDQELLHLRQQGRAGAQAGPAGGRLIRHRRRLPHRGTARLQLQELPPVLPAGAPDRAPGREGAERPASGGRNR
ncbi:UNVERIFIED_CONTAM: mcpU [Trichonephila clavipes]